MSNPKITKTLLMIENAKSKYSLRLSLSILKTLLYKINNSGRWITKYIAYKILHN